MEKNDSSINDKKEKKREEIKTWSYVRISNRDLGGSSSQAVDDEGPLISRRTNVALPCIAQTLSRYIISSELDFMEKEEKKERLISGRGKEIQAYGKVPQATREMLP